MQAQDSPPLSFLALDVDEYLEEEETSLETVSAQQAETSLADTIKDQLQVMLTYLQKDVIDLVQDAEPIRDIFKVIKNQLDPELYAAIAPAAYIEGQEFKVLTARQRLADRSAQQTLIEQKNAGKQEVLNLKQQLEDLNAAPAQIDDTINRLRTEETRLESLLAKVRADIQIEEQKKVKISETVNKVTEEMKLKAQRLHGLYKSIKAIPGTAVEDQQAIDEVDQIRLRAVNAIQEALGSL